MLTIFDRDILELRNLDRQLFNQNSVGKYKAMELMKHARIRGARAVTEWFTDATPLNPTDHDLIICVADNHPARNAALTQAERLKIPAIIGGNEYYDSQAYLYVPEKTKDPRETYPEISTQKSGDPISCQGEEQEIHPQLALANFRCASHIADLLWLYHTETKFLITEIYTAKTATQHIFHE